MLHENELKMQEYALKIQYDIGSSSLICSAIPFHDFQDTKFISEQLHSAEVDAINLTIGRNNKDFDFWTVDYGMNFGEEVIPEFFMSFRDMFSTRVYGWTFLVTGLTPAGQTVGLTTNDLAYVQNELRIWN